MTASSVLGLAHVAAGVTRSIRSPGSSTLSSSGPSARRTASGSQAPGAGRPPWSSAIAVTFARGPTDAPRRARPVLGAQHVVGDVQLGHAGEPLEAHDVRMPLLGWRLYASVACSSVASGVSPSTAYGSIARILAPAREWSRAVGGWWCARTGFRG